VGVHQAGQNVLTWQGLGVWHWPFMPGAEGVDPPHLFALTKRQVKPGDRPPVHGDTVAVFPADRREMTGRGSTISPGGATLNCTPRRRQLLGTAIQLGECGALEWALVTEGIGHTAIDAVFAKVCHPEGERRLWGPVRSPRLGFGIPDDEVTFELLDASELPAWLARSRAAYIDGRMASGDTPEEATANADASLERSFPAGTPVPGQLVGRVKSGGEPIGWLWLGQLGSDQTRWWVWEVEVDEKLRGHGNGRKMMVLAENLARNHGATSIGLNVFAHNTVARELYASLGYAETSVQMRKTLDTSTNTG
jgi:ribosomal protein S18 acetylase RimI-like enzyme